MGTVGTHCAGTVGTVTGRKNGYCVLHTEYPARVSITTTECKYRLQIDQ